mmetsp:Transcript_8282/g.23830  ORF Transcript_8282/g.23830 Transcript_8282/m.23830 type:complete len:269 (+) Transcript_8282:1178-1984(+)
MRRVPPRFALWIAGVHEGHRCVVVRGSRHPQGGHLGARHGRHCRQQQQAGNHLCLCWRRMSTGIVGFRASVQHGPSGIVASVLHHRADHRRNRLLRLGVVRFLLGAVPLCHRSFRRIGVAVDRFQPAAAEVHEAHDAGSRDGLRLRIRVVLRGHFGVRMRVLGGSQQGDIHGQVDELWHGHHGIIVCRIVDLLSCEREGRCASGRDDNETGDGRGRCKHKSQQVEGADRRYPSHRACGTLAPDRCCCWWRRCCLGMSRYDVIHLKNCN